MATHSSIGEYRPNLEVWSAYAERLEHYFATNEVADGGKKRVILHSVCRPSTYGLIRSLVAPQKATDFSYTEIVEKVNRHYNSRPSAVVQWFKFNSRTHQPGETVAAYVAELRKLSEFREFADTLDKMLHDRLVWQIVDSRIQHRLLAEGFLTFPKALEIAQAMEVATCDLKDLQMEACSTLVNKLQGHKTPSSPEVSHTLLPLWREACSCARSRLRGAGAATR